MIVIALNNDMPVAATVFDQPTPTSIKEPAIGLTDIEIFIAESPMHPAIHSSLSPTVAEIQPGTYAAMFLGANLTTYLTDYVGEIVYVCVKRGTHMLLCYSARVVDKAI